MIFCEPFGKQLFFGGVALWACKGTSQNNVFGRSGGSTSLALSHGGEGPGPRKEISAHMQELLRLVGKLFDD